MKKKKKNKNLNCAGMGEREEEVIVSGARWQLAFSEKQRYVRVPTWNCVV